MARNYLNQREQMLLWKLGALAGMCEDEIDTISKHTPDKKDLLKCLRYCKTYSEKAMDELTRNLPDRLLVQYVDRLKRREIGLVVENLEHKKCTELPQEDIVNLELEDFMELAEKVIEGACLLCQMDTECRLRDIFISKNVPMFDEYAEVCPYKVD